MRLLLVNGPNLNLLGKREQSIYGSRTLESIEKGLELKAKSKGISIDCFQSNSETGIVERIHESIGNIDGILINAGAYTHTSIAIRDALLGVNIPYVELHLSNTAAREEFRHRSFISEHAVGVVTGFGDASYDLAMDGLLSHLNNINST